MSGEAASLSVLGLVTCFCQADRLRAQALWPQREGEPEHSLQPWGQHFPPSLS